MSLSAQDNTIRLTVSGEGATKEEATANALRSAIEQAFGTFVSANTQILNDDIVKDEIATISSGNIQEYTELGCITMPDGHKSVSLSATVSIGNLISYAKSKGSTAEFAGSVWAVNIKMRKLNAENERKAIEHMLEQLEILSKDMYRIEIAASKQPIKINWDGYEYKNLKKTYTSQPYFIDFQLKYYSTPVCKLFYDLLFNSLQSISLSEDEIKEYKESGEPIYGLSFRQAVNEDVQIFGIGPRDLTATTAFSDHYSRGRKEFSLSVYYFRNDIVNDILSSIYKFFLDAQLAQWQIVRISTDWQEESITFKSIHRISERDYRRDCFHLYWRSYPKNRLIECVNHNNGFGCNSFPFADIYNYPEFGEEQIRITNLQKMMQDSNEIATCTIKMGFTEEELKKTTKWVIKKIESHEDKNVQQNNEIWYTNGSTTEPMDFHVKGEDEGNLIILSNNYSTDKKCWIIRFDGDVTQFSLMNEDVESISIPNSVTEIEDWAFGRCIKLKSITIPNGVTSIGKRAFYGCSSLESIIIPNSVTSIGDWAFDGCVNLKTIYCKSSTPPGGSQMSLGIPKECIIYVPMGTSNAYKEAMWWGRHDIVEMSSKASASTNNNQSSSKVYSNAYDGYINIRDSSTSKGTIIGKFKNGPDGAICLSQTGEWTKINYKGVTGYVYTKYLSDSPTEDVTLSIDGNWLKGIWRNAEEQYAYLIFNNGTFALQSASGTLAYGTYMLKGNDIEFNIKQFLSSMEISKIKRFRIDSSSDEIGPLRKQSFLNNTEMYGNSEGLTWTESQYLALRNEIRKLLETGVSAAKTESFTRTDDVRTERTETLDSVTIKPIPFQIVEEKPSFQGGDINQFLNWVRENQIYPEIAKENGIQGRVTVRATINTDGSLTDIMVVRGVDPSLDKEAIRVVSQSPKWKPGKQGGKAVPVTYNFPITFQIR